MKISLRPNSITVFDMKISLRPNVTVFDMKISLRPNSI